MKTQYVTHVVHLRDGDPWPMPLGNAMVSGMWEGARKIVAITPSSEQRGGQYSKSAIPTRLTVWWIEEVRTEDPLPPPTDYEKVREELQV